MKTRREKELAARWWWRDGDAIKPEAKYNFCDGQGKPFREVFQRGEWMQFARAAFNYEVEARIKEDDARGGSRTTPGAGLIYRFQVPFPELRYWEKVGLQHEYPAQLGNSGLRAFSFQPGEKPDFVSEADWVKVLTSREQLPKDAMGFRISFFPGQTTERALMRSLQQTIRQAVERENLPFARRMTIKPPETYKWANLELADRWLSRLLTSNRQQIAAHNFLETWRAILKRSSNPA